MDKNSRCRWREVRWITGAAAVFALSCASSPPGGLLVGDWRTPDGSSQKVAVSFRREAYGRGMLSMQLGESGERFSGPYLRIHEAADEGRVRRMHEMWVSDDFDGWERDPAGRSTAGSSITLDGFRRRYDHVVVATLTGSRGSLMRCHLELIDAERGLPGGATGTCQASQGDVVVVERRRRPGSGENTGDE